MEEEFLLRHDDCPTEPIIRFSQSLISSLLQIIKHVHIFFFFSIAISCLFCSNCKCLYSCKKNSAGKKYCYCTLCLVCNVMMCREWSPCLNVSTAQTSVFVSLCRLLVKTHTGICVWVLINVPFFSVALQ